MSETHFRRPATLGVDRSTLSSNVGDQFNTMPYGFGNPEATYFTEPAMLLSGDWVVHERYMRKPVIVGTAGFETYQQAADYYREKTGMTPPPEIETRAKFRFHSLPEFHDEAGKWRVIVYDIDGDFVEDMLFDDLQTAMAFSRSSPVPESHSNPAGNQTTNP